VTDANGDFRMTDILPGVYQFGIPITNETFGIVWRDNDAHASGFTQCFDFTARSQEIGFGIQGQE